MEQPQAPDRNLAMELARVTEAQIRRMFEHARDPSLPTDYD